MSSCAPRSQSQGWELVLLHHEKPLEGSIQAVTGHLGIERSRKKFHMLANAGQVFTLKQEVPSRAVYELRLGSSPFFSYVPLSVPARGFCPRYTVKVRDGKQEKKVGKVVSRFARHPAPGEVCIDLKPWENRTIQLILESTGASNEEDPRFLLWGSPVVAYKKTFPRVKQEKPNVIFIGIDTLRADALGVYGHQPSLTPNLDAFAKESDVWEWTFSAFNTTNPSFCSMMTGLYGKHHGVYDLLTPLPDTFSTLAEILKNADYHTGAIVSARHLARNAGLKQGFQDYYGTTEHYSTEMAVQTAMDWMQEAHSPFFLWLHIFDPHVPHTPPDPFFSGLMPRETVGLRPPTRWISHRLPGHTTYQVPRHLGSREHYYDEVAYLDYHLGKLFTFLKSRELLSNSYVVIVADHGENLGEYGIICRHIGLWDTTTRVPLMIRSPKQQAGGRKYHNLVQTIDIFPTLLRFLEIPIPSQDGRDLYPSRLQEERQWVFAEHANKQGAMLRSLKWSYMEIEQKGISGTYFYDLRQDPQQRMNLFGKKPEETSRLKNLLSIWRKPSREVESPVPGAISDEDRRQLKAIGYLQ